MKKLFGILLSVLAISATAQSIPVEIFTLSTQPVTTNVSQPVDIQYYTLDAAATLLTEFNAALTQHQDAIWFMKNKLKLQQAFKGLEFTQQYSITQLPAIVFNHEAVVEGNTNLDSALSEYVSWQKK